MNEVFSAVRLFVLKLPCLGRSHWTGQIGHQISLILFRFGQSNPYVAPFTVIIACIAFVLVMYKCQRQLLVTLTVGLPSLNVTTSTIIRRSAVFFIAASGLRVTYASVMLSWPVVVSSQTWLVSRCRPCNTVYLLSCLLHDDGILLQLICLTGFY